MVGDLNLLTATAFTAGMVHTLLGPDHYVPFVALSRSNGWGLGRTLALTTLCGLGHVLSSVAIGAIGLLVGAAVMRVELVEAFRGEAAAWMLLAFGLAYLVWGVKRAWRHGQGQSGGFAPPASEGRSAAGVTTPWLLFLIFVFGPCEVLAPLLMYPAASADVGMVFSVVIAFTVATLGTMLAAVVVSLYGLRWFESRGVVSAAPLHRFSHAFAGAAVTACGAMVKFGF